MFPGCGCNWIRSRQVEYVVRGGLCRHLSLVSLPPLGGRVGGTRVADSPSKTRQSSYKPVLTARKNRVLLVVGGVRVPALICLLFPGSEAGFSCVLGVDPDATGDRL